MKKHRTTPIRVLEGGQKGRKGDISREKQRVGKGGVKSKVIGKEAGTPSLVSASSSHPRRFQEPFASPK